MVKYILWPYSALLLDTLGTKESFKGMEYSYQRNLLAYVACSYLQGVFEEDVFMPITRYILYL